MDVAGRSKRRAGRIAMAAATAVLCAPLPARADDALTALLFGWRALLPRQLRAADPYAPPVALDGELPFAAPVGRSNLFEVDLLGVDHRWRAGFACDEEQRHLSDPGALVRIQVAVRF